RDLVAEVRNGLADPELQEFAVAPQAGHAAERRAAARLQGDWTRDGRCAVWFLEQTRAVKESPAVPTLCRLQRGCGYIRQDLVVHQSRAAGAKDRLSRFRGSRSPGGGASAAGGGSQPMASTTRIGPLGRTCPRGVAARAENTLRVRARRWAREKRGGATNGSSLFRVACDHRQN